MVTMQDGTGTNKNPKSKHKKANSIPLSCGPLVQNQGPPSSFLLPIPDFLTYLYTPVTPTDP